MFNLNLLFAEIETHWNFGELVNAPPLEGAVNIKGFTAVALPAQRVNQKCCDRQVPARRLASERQPEDDSAWKEVALGAWSLTTGRSRISSNCQYVSNASALYESVRKSKPGAYDFLTCPEVREKACRDALLRLHTSAIPTVCKLVLFFQSLKFPILLLKVVMVAPLS